MAWEGLFRGGLCGRIFLLVQGGPEGSAMAREPVTDPWVHLANSHVLMTNASNLLFNPWETPFCENQTPLMPLASKRVDTLTDLLSKPPDLQNQISKGRVYPPPSPSRWSRPDSSNAGLKPRMPCKTFGNRKFYNLSHIGEIKPNRDCVLIVYWASKKSKRKSLIASRFFFLFR